MLTAQFKPRRDTINLEVRLSSEDYKEQLQNQRGEFNSVIQIIGGCAEAGNS